MLNSAVKNSKFDELINEVISVDECKKFKPHKDVYNLVIDKFNINKKNCIFFQAIVGIFMEHQILVFKQYG